jgi:hypothetical protein
MIYCCQRFIRDVTFIKRYGRPWDWRCVYVRGHFLSNVPKTYCLFTSLTATFVFPITEYNMLSKLHVYVYLTPIYSPDQSACATGCADSSVHYRYLTTKYAVSFFLCSQIIQHSIHPYSMVEFTSLFRLLHTQPFPEFNNKQTHNSIMPHVKVKWDHSLYRYCLP